MGCTAFVQSQIHFLEKWDIFFEIAEITQVSLGTVKSRITRGRDALRKRLTGYIREVGAEIGVSIEQEDGDGRHGIKHARVEVTS